MSLIYPYILLYIHIVQFSSMKRMFCRQKSLSIPNWYGGSWNSNYVNWIHHLWRMILEFVRKYYCYDIVIECFYLFGGMNYDFHGNGMCFEDGNISFFALGKQWNHFALGVRERGSRNIIGLSVYRRGNSIFFFLFRFVFFKETIEIGFSNICCFYIQWMVVIFQNWEGVSLRITADQNKLNSETSNGLG